MSFVVQQEENGLKGTQFEVYFMIVAQMMWESNLPNFTTPIPKFLTNLKYKSNMGLWKIYERMEKYST